MRRWETNTSSPEATRALGELLGGLGYPGAVILLCGDLGAGKTCLAQGIAKGLGVPDDEPVTSPSYTLMNHYRGRLDLYHFDLYRLGALGDLDDLGFDEYIYGGGVSVVEWANRFGELDLPALRISLDTGHDEGRSLIFEAPEGALSQLLDTLAKRWGERNG